MLLLADPQINQMLTKQGHQEATIVASSGADGDIVLPRPHLILRMGSKDQGVGTVHRRDLQVWAHDEPGDYSVIDDLLNRVRIVLTAVEAYQVTDGKWISCITWQGDSEDLYDDGPGTIVRNGSYIVTGSGG